MALVVVPYVDQMLNQHTRRVVQRSGLAHLFVQLDPNDQGGYGRLFRRLWREGRTFVICEQDIVPTREQLLTISECGHDWCCYQYDDSLYPVGPMFGLSRFSARLMAEHPHAADVALIRGARRDQEAPWWQVDSLMAADLMIRLPGKPDDGEVPGAAERARYPWRAAGCVLHLPPVHHAHRGPPSGPPG